MAQIGSVRPSFAHATQELTVAAANLNFDFTLVRIEAPAEYKAIGTALTASRAREAETGPLHMTARRLGALFEGICPETLNLIKAYGVRASEISREVSRSLGDEHPSRNSNWIRTEYGGIDATSLWAAATSSRAALPIHLLACIIARMWTSSEGVSLWVEIVAERKREVCSEFEDTGHIPAPLASAIQQEITRDHLAKWDASARAWLQTADKAREYQHKQFLLIVKNLSIAIHKDNTSLYSNVVSVWTSALTAMENLVCGTPCMVRDGPVLLGLSAWHIFPDMIVFNIPGGSTMIPMNDAMVKEGGVLSLGISDQGRQEEQGIYWSLSLAHHRFYGEAVKRTRRLDVDGSRLSLNELILVCLGSLLRCWSIPKSDSENAVRTIQSVIGAFPREKNETISNDLRAVLDGPLNEYLSGNTQAILATLLGRRRPKFLPTPITVDHRPLFGLSVLSTLLFILKEPDRKIELLRRLASRIPGLNNENCVMVSFEDSSPRINYIFASVFRDDVLLPDGREATHNHPLTKSNKKFKRWIQRPDWLKMPANTKFHRSDDFIETKLLRNSNSPLEMAYNQENNLGPEEKESSVSEPDPQFFIGGSDSNYENEHNASGFRNGSTLVGSIDTDKVQGLSADRHLNSLRAITNDIKTSDDDISSQLDSQLKTSSPRENIYYHTSHDQSFWLVDLDQTPDGPSTCRIEGEQEGSLDKERFLEKQFLQTASKSGFIEKTLDDTAMEKTANDFKKECNSYLSDIERTLTGENVEFLENSNHTNTFTPWHHKYYSDVVIHTEDPQDEYVFAFGQRKGCESVDHIALIEHTALYIKEQSIGEILGPQLGQLMENLVSIEDILWCFEFDLVDPSRLRMLVHRQPALSFLKVLTAVHEIYWGPAMGGATITCSIIENTFDPPIFSKKLLKDDWTEAQSFVAVNQNSAIGLIGYFETGTNVIEGMKGNYKILGLSGGDSIYVLTALLRNPDTEYPDYSFSRILGNTGNAGFSILTSPSELMVRKLDPGAWRLEPQAFDGTPQYNFKNTSLHLGFTDWRAPLVNFRSVGERSADINIIEAVISVRDSGKWVADVDIYHALINQRLTRQERTCPHVGTCLKVSDILSIETWDQVLDCADGPVAVRCHDNWVARLAVVSVLAQHLDEERPIVVCRK